MHIVFYIEELHYGAAQCPGLFSATALPQRINGMALSWKHKTPSKYYYPLL